MPKNKNLFRLDPTLRAVKETVFDEMRHLVVKRRRDNTYWYVSYFRGPHGWVPMEVQNQSGRETDALVKYHESLA